MCCCAKRKFISIKHFVDNKFLHIKWSLSYFSFSVKLSIMSLKYNLKNHFFLDVFFKWTICRIMDCLLSFLCYIKVMKKFLHLSILNAIWQCCPLWVSLHKLSVASWIGLTERGLPKTNGSQMHVSNVCPYLCWHVLEWDSIFLNMFYIK